ncbi:YbaB/EbfC family nucleoid-associated protein [Nocardia fluminea]|uniref:YbaB/EbfC DNA-binding family protein n=1 Tax=Nocardia fluminea TaxID=134984 RepID=A0A2N3VIS2_9NOCA|nr:YbaB/EbfC family nucleoid-associated protein [Nocardia fluminea]PKV81517.1 YbaB/EbfC DNA-binding family protein [Nocardia fluminea]
MDDLNNAAAELSRWAEDLEQKAQRYQELHAEMTAVSVTDTSADGRISVTVDANGSTTAITLAAAVRGMDPTAVATELMACTHRAQARLRDQVTGLVQDTVGADEAGQAIVGQYSDRFPDLDPSASAAVPPPPMPAAPAAPVASWPSEPEAPATRKPDRDRVVAPEEPSDEDLFYQRKSWLQ